MVLKEQIDKIVQEGDWAFASLLKLNDVCEDLAESYYSNLDASTIVELIWDVYIEDCDATLGQIISKSGKDILKKEFMTSFQKCFETATVKFKSPAQEVKVAESIPEELPPLPKKKKMVKGDDGIDAPKGVKRV